MLTRLVIQNYAIIPKLDVEFKKGLTIITGETGAGKSILLGALGLALGKRAESKVLPEDASKCIVEAHFLLPDKSLKTVFEKEEIDFDQQIICRREISQGGRSRSFINDSAVSLKTLQDIASYLAELHHQHDNLALQTREYQLHVIDNVSNAESLLKEYQSIYNAWHGARHELDRLREVENSSARKKDFLAFQINELSQAKLTAGEIASLEDSQNALEHAEAIEHAIDQMRLILQEGPHSLNFQVSNLLKHTQPIAKYYIPLEELNARLETLRIEIQDLALEAGRLDGPGGKDSNKLSRIQSRLNQLYSLIKKYNCHDETQLIRLFEELKSELGALSSNGELINELEAKISQLYISLTETGSKLQAKRKAGTKKFIPKIAALLNELGMPNARMDIDITPLSTPGPTGLDEVQFTFSANKGMSLLPLQAVASGGELSRLSLAIKSVYAREAKLPTIVFDEIDTGISGEVAWRMGQLIRSLSSGHQILMITHSPQIAAHADQQFHVSKITGDQKDISAIQALKTKQRVTEIAKMLSGDPPSPAAIKNAESLINKAAV